MKPLQVFFLVGLGLVVGLGLGGVLGQGPSAEPVSADTVPRAELERRLAESEGELTRLRDQVARTRQRTGGSSADSDAANETEVDVAPVVPVEAGDMPVQLPGPEERARRIDELRAAVPVWFEQGDGTAAVAALRELAGMVPEGREAAMEVALLINEDVSGEGKLNLSDVEFYGGLGDPNVRALMDWALERPESPPGFRVIAAYSLPWTQAPDQTLAQFGSALSVEADVSVQRALVANIGRLNSPEAQRLLGGILADPDRDASLRASAATELATTEDPMLVQAIEAAAASDAEPAVRDAARAALVLRNPPATGYLVTGTVPQSQAAAAGLRAGDVLVSYNGTPTVNVEALRTASAQAEGQDEVRVVVVRDGEEVEVLLRPGRLGVYGRAVEAAER